MPDTSPTPVDDLTHEIATILDKPSVYMGGPSRRSLTKAAEVVEWLRSSRAQLAEAQAELLIRGRGYEPVTDEMLDADSSRATDTGKDDRIRELEVAAADAADEIAGGCWSDAEMILRAVLGGNNA